MAREKCSSWPGYRIGANTRPDKAKVVSLTVQIFRLTLALPLVPYTMYDVITHDVITYDVIQHRSASHGGRLSQDEMSAI